ncbi:hypothetical protein CH298_13165 [Rhodococcoides fascians]|uniref:hypothetical protein n=1 Tax=Rhodococcoides fascians TaxID=1828 RepID=UPI000B9BE892|nr:hypothetical protein [Rhodococcus fascians]OZE89930.1 hypothetical protein CH303_13045 [Rhodococcus fascians]OZF18237.1 hypothetical protein CH298_13165 [Rhodococcus fascians]OZF21688.1 hypothetical protein CH297_13060 [Rhodococcus fascians]OZF67313.1 hypothetical protein CH308_12960 [Rhodococcus fascians]OZF70502.1 hypothetical protein CH307_13155 [Rhodococcus fascians]
MTSVQAGDEYHYFTANPLELAVATMFNVILRKPSGVVYYYLDEYKRKVYKTLGSITVSPASGRIIVWPLNGLKEIETKFLIGTAERAFRTPPTKATGWGFNRRKAGNYWFTFISAPVDPEEDAVAKAALAQSNMHFDSNIRNAVEKQITEVAS